MVVSNMLGLVVYVFNNGEKFAISFQNCRYSNSQNIYDTPSHNNYNKNWHLSVSYIGLRSFIHYMLALLPL